MEYVLTESVYVSNVFEQQKIDLQFDSNEEFLLFLLNNTTKLATIAGNLSPILDKLLGCRLSTSCHSPSTPTRSQNYVDEAPHDRPSSPDLPEPSTAEIRNIVRSIKQMEERERHNSRDDEEAEGTREPTKRHTPSRFRSNSSLSEGEDQPHSSKRHPSVNPTKDYHVDAGDDETEYTEERHIIEDNRQETYSPEPPAVYRQTGEDMQERGDERVLFSSAHLLEKSNAALQISDEVMHINKPHSSAVNHAEASGTHTHDESPGHPQQERPASSQSHHEHSSERHPMCSPMESDVDRSEEGLSPGPSHHRHGNPTSPEQTSRGSPHTSHMHQTLQLRTDYPPSDEEDQGDQEATSSSKPSQHRHNSPPPQTSHSEETHTQSSHPQSTSTHQQASSSQQQQQSNLQRPHHQPQQNKQQPPHPHAQEIIPQPPQERLQERSQDRPQDRSQDRLQESPQERPQERSQERSQERPEERPQSQCTTTASSPPRQGQAIRPNIGYTIAAGSSEPRLVPTTQRLVLPRTSSPFKTGHLIAVPLALGNEMKGIPIPPITHSQTYTTVGQASRAATTTTSTASTQKTGQKDTEQNRENLNNTNEMDTSDGQDKLYICPVCNKEFKGSGRVRNCKIHINTVHLKHKPYKCNFCNVRFGYKDYMKRHLIRHHKSLFYSYDTDSVLEKYTTYDVEEPGEEEHDPIPVQDQ